MNGSPPLLRAPPFPGVDACVTRPLAEDESAAPHDAAALFAMVREARIGGTFWADPLAVPHPGGVVLRPRTVADIAPLLGALPPAQRKQALWIAPDASRTWARALSQLVTAEGGSWQADTDPWSALPDAGELVAHGDDEWVALARIAGRPVRVFAAGRFGTPGCDMAALDGLAVAALTAIGYRDPFTGQPATIETAIDLLACWRATLQGNRPIVAACGMAWWKRAEIRRFLWHPQRPLHIVSRPAKALKLARRAGGSVAIWPSRVSDRLLESARQQGVPLVRVEDGFVRSVGLGVDLVPPSSVVVDASGIHFDPSGPSDLETVLNGTEFSPRLLQRAASLRETIVAAGISKYAAGTSGPAAVPTPARQGSRRLVLVPGQVEDDMSVLAGGGGLRSNLELLRRARAMEPDAEIWFRPHPDVDAGHRNGAVDDDAAMAYADKIVRGGGMAPLLGVVDAVHVLTSLTGFEALLRGCEVICHGTPFYAGWGLTRDIGMVPDRRSRQLTLDELVAGVLILYPRYLDPVTALPCPPEVLVGRMASSGAPNRLNWIGPLRRWQGRLAMALKRA